ncbi:MAG: undecaprenyl-phosphate glucose phosphotransferase [Kiritimatiellae bacterium]|nr:undecaprenyl-phosphate glucose phosphotransferase [Kiritimatiellia bacterium]
MRAKDTFDVLMSTTALIVDAVFIYIGFITATWIRFDSGWIPLYRGYPPQSLYQYGAGLATILFLFIFLSLGLYKRPQVGHFIEKIPRLIRATGLGIFLVITLAYIINTEPPIARMVVFLSFFTVNIFILIERKILFQLERHWAKYQASKKRVAILGTGPIAGQLKQALEQEPRLRSRLIAFFKTNNDRLDPHVPAELVKGHIEDLPEFLKNETVDEIILANPSSLTHAAMVKIIVQCERALANFIMVPDIFRVLTSGVSMQLIDGIPMLGVGTWPLDRFWNRLTKRSVDIAGAWLGLILSIPVMAISAIIIKATSPGPILYKQKRCGEKGTCFTIYKLRTMQMDAEIESGPVWTTQDDTRRTPAGKFMRKYNIDELPQFWNVLKGEMSLVGPRPERPHFVEQFKEDIGGYMWRHTSKPGLTGWAQVNGLRGNTSIEARIKHDLFYLENWSLGLDLKVLLRTIFARENAY